MKKIITLFIALTIFPSIGWTLLSQPVAEPPATNPHPPVTEQDKARVDFAVLAMETYLKTPAADAAQIPAEYKKKNKACLLDAQCKNSDVRLLQDITSFQNSFGLVTEFRHPHIIPWSYEKFKSKKTDSESVKNQDMHAAKMVANTPQLKSDEYMVHIYAKFLKTGEWQHLDVILSEDNQGNVSFMYFFIAPMNRDLPPGTVCKLHRRPLSFSSV